MKKSANFRNPPHRPTALDRLGAVPHLFAAPAPPDASADAALRAAQACPGYIPNMPICQQLLAVEECWWAAVFAARGIAEPTTR